MSALELPVPIPLRRPAGRAALVVAHPGHELRVHGWLEQARPVVFALTDGSGGHERPRLTDSAALLELAGARAGTLFGSFADKQLYATLLRGEHAPLLAWAAELHRELLLHEVEYVVADPRDGYNPAHDLVRLVVDAVVERLRGTGRTLGNYSLVLRGSHELGSGPARHGLELDDAALERKLRAARAYRSLEHEVGQALQALGPQGLRTERLHDVPAGGWPMPPGLPYYETFGESQVAAGRYSEVLRHARHVAPLERLLADDAF